MRADPQRVRRVLAYALARWHRAFVAKNAWGRYLWSRIHDNAASRLALVEGRRAG
jgi:hypothetical protein